MYDVVCLASGGLDSLVCLSLLKKKGISALPLFINYGQRNHIREYASLCDAVLKYEFAAPVVIDISGFGKSIQTGLTDRSKRVKEDAFTPNRNLLFLVLASSVAYTRGVSYIAVGLLSEEIAIFPDQSDEFLALAQAAIAGSLGVRMTIVCPLRDMVKQNVLELAHTLGIENYYSCHEGSEIPCGKCIACLEYKSGG